jgi:hypothetical protein
MIFLSILGTQTMAVINPLLSLIKNGPRPEKIVLLVTPYIKERKGAQQMAAEQLIMEKVGGLGCPATVEICEISEGLTPDDQERPPAQGVVAEMVGGGAEICFNLAGGMNFQVAACIQAMSASGGLFLYPEQRRVYAIQKGASNTLSIKPWPLPKAEHVLKLQGLSAEVFPSPQANLIRKLFNQCDLPLPTEQVFAIRIGELEFDYFFNDQNTLRFMKVMKGKENSPQGFRRLAAQVNDRALFGDLYHKEVALLTRDINIADRIAKESLGNLHRIKAARWPQEIAKQRKDLRRFMGFIFDPDKPDAVPAVETYGETNGQPSALITTLGADPVPTLIAIWSARKEHLILLYTPSDPTIMRYKAAFIANLNLLPCKTITFVPVGLSGHEFLGFERPAPQEVAVNITPGTKGHGAMLALWAKLHGADTYSNSAQGLYSFKEHCTTPLTAPPPAAVLALAGHRLLSEGTSGDDLQKQSDIYDAITRFLEKIRDAGKSVKPLFEKRSVRIHADSLVVVTKDGIKTATLHLEKENKEVEFSLEGGEWFEQFVAYRILACGADELRVRMRTDWDEAIRALYNRWHHEKEHRQVQSVRNDCGTATTPLQSHECAKNPQTPPSTDTSEGQIMGGNGQDLPPEVHMTDIDVAVRFKGNYVVVECKSGAGVLFVEGAMDSVTRGVKAVAGLFGRFAIPMVCLLKYEKEPYRHDSGVYIFGYKTLIDTPCLTELIHQAINAKSTTST